MDDREIAPCHAPSGELSHERVVGQLALGDDEQARGVLVEPVDDTRAPRPADARDGGRVGQERRGEGGARVTGAGVDDDAGRLVEDEDVRVLEHDRERRRLGDELLGGGRRHVDLDPLAPRQPRRGLPDSAVDADAAGLDQRLEPRTREPGQPLGEPAVEPRPRRGGADGEPDEPGRGGGLPHGRGADAPSPRRRMASTVTPTVIAESATLNAGQCHPR